MQEFKLREKTYKFDSSGDINLGYDVVMWTSEGSKIPDLEVVAEYHPLSNNFTYMDHLKASTRQLLEDLKVGPPAVTLMLKHLLSCSRSTCSTHKEQPEFSKVWSLRAAG